ncbi:helix-turn-helix transcriptional regulator [Rubrimonas sp.]|uniref:helix-turn-helix transcriptional regulator n=1 Tax=Rubrimonas sp. TaxID=2036015 RepID=UPI002FDCF491
MIAVVPSIRAAVLSPILRWMVGRGLPVEEALQEAALGAWVAEDADGFAPILNSAELLRRLGRTEGPDVFCRIGASTSFSEIGAIGVIALARRTPRLALHAIVDFMPRHSTHERIAVEDTPEGIRFIDLWGLGFDQEALHYVQQYVAALAQAICRATAAEAPLFSRVEIAPHPTAGLAHLRPCFGLVEAATEPKLVIDIPARVADARLKRPAGDVPREAAKLSGTGGEVDFVQSLRWTISAIMGAGSISIDDVAAAAGTSPRTLQRRLAAHDVAFSDMVDEMRRETALRLLGSECIAMGDVAVRLGYANASALSRAVRRWTGETPRAIRAKALAGKRVRRKATGVGGVQR